MAGLVGVATHEVGDLECEHAVEDVDADAVELGSEGGSEAT